jgi:dynein heavy chain, axonemal
LGSLLERDVIKNDFETKYSHVVRLLEEEMDDTKKLFDVQKRIKDSNNQITVHRNLPEISGGLKWCQELKDRISKPMDTFNKLIEHPIAKSEQMNRVNKKYHELIALLDAFLSDIYMHWSAEVGKLALNNLEKNLIFRDPKSKSINTNFDPQVNLNI